MKKKILVVGGGGREHAIIKALKKSPDCGEVWCAPGNGGISYDARCNPLGRWGFDPVPPKGRWVSPERKLSVSKLFKRRHG